MLFVCTHNAGRSAIGAALACIHGRGLTDVDSAGVAPAEEPSRAAITGLAEIGIDEAARRPSALTEQKVRNADIMVAMKPGLWLPQVDHATHVTWSFEDPVGRDADGMRSLREQIETQVKELIAGLILGGSAS